MSKERARRRAEREAVEAVQRARRARRVARRQRRRALLRALTPRLRRNRTGRMLPRRRRTERAAITVCAVGVLLVVWLLVDSLALRLALTAVLLLALPAFVVIALGRRT